MSSLDANTLLANGLSSAAAGIVGRTLTHPLDTAKARLQASNTYSNSLHALSSTLRTEGIRGWYRGFGVVISLGTPGTIMYLSSYEIAKDRLQKNERLPAWASHLASGMIAETIACIVYVPVDVVKERMQVQQSQGGSFYYKNTFDALRQIGQTEGLRGLYRGYGATLASFGPFSALYFVFYERCKSLARSHQSTGQFGLESDLTTSNENSLDLSFSATVLCSATAGAAASWLSSPLDLAKLRLQISRGQQFNSVSSATYRGIVDCLQHAYRHQGGVRGLFRGAGARVLHFCPATTITMTSYEMCRSAVSKLLRVSDY